MICYKDMTFCSRECGNKMCDRNKKNIKKPKELEWMPVSYSDFNGCPNHKSGDKVETEMSLPKWIPCSERLPKGKQEVYVTVYFTAGDTGRAYGYIDGFGKWHLYSTVEGTLNSGYEVTAWMPLPEPYKEDDKE